MYQSFDPYFTVPPEFLRGVPKTFNLARIYIKDQPYSGLLPLDTAMDVGTVFDNIDTNYENTKRGGTSEYGKQF